MASPSPVEIVSDPRSQIDIAARLERHRKTVRLAAWLFMAGYLADDSQPLMRSLHDFRFLFGFVLVGGVLLTIVTFMVRLSSRIAAILLSLFALWELIETLGLVAWRIANHTFPSVWIIDGALLMLSVGVLGVMLSACAATFALHRMRTDDTEILSVFD